jgi:hypothetical protein
MGGLLWLEIVMSIYFVIKSVCFNIIDVVANLWDLAM